MKSRWLALLLALLLILSACGKQPEGSTGEELPQENLPVEPVQPEPEETEPVEPEEPELFDDTSIAVPGNEDFYDLTALPALEGVEIADAALLGEDQVVLLTGPGGAQIQLLDLNTGRLRPLCQLEQGEDGAISYSLLHADPLIVAANGMSVLFFRVDLDGSVTQLPYGEENDWLSYYMVAFTDSCFYQYEEQTGTVYRYNRDGTGKTEVGQVPADYLYIQLKGVSSSGDQLIFQAQAARDSVTMVMECADGTLSAVYAGWDCGKALLAGTQFQMDYPQEVGAPYTLTAWKDGQQVTAEVRLDGLCQTQGVEDLENCWMEEPPSGTPWGKSLVKVWNGLECYLLLWDYGQEETQAAPVELVEYTWPVCDLGELTDRAEAMEETYGVEIYLGQEAEMAPFPDYSLEGTDDLGATSDALDVLEQALSYYPEGYLEQLGGDTVREFCFYLCGRMTPLDASVSIDDPGGLTCQVDGLELIAFNVDYIRVQDVVHELTHVLDHWLWAEETLDEETWNSFNPEGFHYYEAYIDETGESYEFSGSTAYTTWDEAWYSGDADSVYFIDRYSKTFPTEDRARLMEYVLAGSDGVPDSYFASVHLQAKLTYYFQCIRDTFDTTGWPEQTSWEQALASVAPEQEG